MYFHNLRPLLLIIIIVALVYLYLVTNRSGKNNNTKIGGSYIQNDPKQSDLTQLILNLDKKSRAITNSINKYKHEMHNDIINLSYHINSRTPIITNQKNTVTYAENKIPDNNNLTLPSTDESILYDTNDIKIVDPYEFDHISPTAITATTNALRPPISGPYKVQKST